MNTVNSSNFKALEMWRHAIVASVRGDAPDLSARQMALLLSVYMGEGPHTVRGLAQTLRISKPAVSRALDRLGELEYIRRERDDLDRRNVLIQRTEGGSSFLEAFGALIAEAQTYIATLPEKAVETKDQVATAMNAVSAVGSVAEPKAWAEVAA